MRVEVLNPDVSPIFVVYPYLQLYCVFLFKVYIKSDSEKKFSLSISDTEHDSKRRKSKKIICIAP